MSNTYKKIFSRFPLMIAAGLATTAVSVDAQSATATISDTPAGGGEFDYTITLKNTGSQNLEGFWYGWTDNGNNLPSNPSNAGSSLGWAVNFFGGNSIQWQGGAGDPLTQNSTATFTFESTSTLAQITASPSGESVAYTGTIGFNEGISGTSTPVFSPTPAAVPEPSSFSLVVCGLLVMAGSCKSLMPFRKME